MERLRIIGVEEHMCTSRLRDALRSLPYEVAGISYTDSIYGKLCDVNESRVRDMDAMGVDVQVLSLTTPATQVLEPHEAVTLAREANDFLAELVAANPTRYQGFATLPTPDPDAALDELERCISGLGHRGIMLHGRTGDKFIDHPDFAPIFARAAELRVPIHLHPQRPAATVSDFYYMQGLPEAVGKALSLAAWGWHVETAVNAIRLIISGAFERSPDLQIILGHWGELVPFFLERIDHMLGRVSREIAFAPTFLEHFHVAPAGIWSYPMLSNSISELGADRIMFSIDYPFIAPLDGSARRFLEEAPISPADKHKIGHVNAERLLRLGPANDAPVRH